MVSKYEQRIDIQGVADDAAMANLLQRLNIRDSDSTQRHIVVDKSDVYDILQKIHRSGYRTTPKKWYSIDELMDESRESESFAEETTYYYCDDCDYWHLTNWTPIYWDSGEEDEDGVTWRTLWITSDDSGDTDWDSLVYGESPDDPENQTDWESYLSWVQEKLDDPEYPYETWQEYDPANYLGFMPSKPHVKLEYRIGKSADGAQFWGVRAAGNQDWLRFEDAHPDWQHQIMTEFTLNPVTNNLLYDNRNKHRAGYEEREPYPVFITYIDMCEMLGLDAVEIEFTVSIEFTPGYSDLEVKAWLQNRIKEKRNGN